MHAMSIFLFDYICGVYMKWLKGKSRLKECRLLVKRKKSILFVLVHFPLFLGGVLGCLLPYFKQQRQLGTTPKFLVRNNIILLKFTRFWLVKLHMNAAGLQLIFNRTNEKAAKALGEGVWKEALGRAKGERNFKNIYRHGRCFKRQFLVYSFKLLCL